MNLTTARAAWHDAYLAASLSGGQGSADLALLGQTIQNGGGVGTCGRAVHQTLAGEVQRAIASLPPHLRVFGDWLYSPLAGDDQREAAEALVYAHAYRATGRMKAAKAERAEYIAAAVLFRYRRVNQGGQGAGVDPLPTVEAFRRYVLDVYGVRLLARNWSREWAPFVARCFAACDALDAAALAPVGRLLAKMRDVA